MNMTTNEWIWIQDGRLAKNLNKEHMGTVVYLNDVGQDCLRLRYKNNKSEFQDLNCSARKQKGFICEGGKFIN